MNNKNIGNLLIFIMLGLCSLIAFSYEGDGAQAAPLTLEVTDFQGQVLHLENARAFIPTPTSCDSCPAKIVTLEGIKVIAAAAPQIIPWDVIVRVEKEKPDHDAITVLLTNGQTQKVALFTELAQFLSGDLDRAEYKALQLKDVKLLNVIRKNDQ